jgi:heme/copper-type cytochrome/quinol oxidase subunit 1
MGTRIHTMFWLALGTIALLPGEALAGMPSPATLTDIARMRVEAISFFLLILFLSAALIQWLWNGLRTSFTRLPRLSYAKAVSLAVLWGLLFMVVLAMISGARELMTPGAWEKHGATYRLINGGR